METLPTDMLVYIAMTLDYPDILALCRTNPRINQKVCGNEQFWLNRIKKEYPNRKNIKSYGDTYKQIYKNLKYPITLDLVIRIEQDGKIKSFSHSIVIDDSTIENMGKYIVYIISQFGETLWKNRKIVLIIFNEKGTEVCNIEPWKHNEACLKYINYDTKRIIVDMSIDDMYDRDLDHNIEKFDKIVSFVNENFNKNVEDWPLLWL